MDLKKKIKGFFTLTRKANSGFTLVELIVVIAILAILGGVAVPAYSGYVTKANKQADVSLASEVEDALMLYYYSNPEAVLQGYVKLGQEGTAVVVDNEADIENSVGAKAMAAVFGEDWRNLHLKYEEWEGDSGAVNYGKTSYYGSEKELLGDIEDLTGALGNAIKDTPSLVGNTFNDFLKDYNLSVENDEDIDAIADAAVLYVADQTKGQQGKIDAAITNAVNNCPNLQGGYAQFANELMANLTIGEDKMNDVAALAVVYASIEGLAQATGKKFNPDFSGQISSPDDAAAELSRAYIELYNQLEEKDLAYINRASEKNIFTDMTGYVGMMNTVSNNKNLVDGTLGQQDTFTNDGLVNTIRGYADAGRMGVTTSEGEVAVILANGLVTTIPVQIN